MEEKLVEIEHCLIFPQKNIVAGVTKRCENRFGEFGFSVKPTLFVSDEVVKENLSLLARQLGINREALLFQKQFHSDIVRIVDKDSVSDFSDAMITDRKGLCLCVTAADCAGVLIYDRQNNVIAGIHSGWRGTRHNIVGKTIAKLGEIYGSAPKDLLVYISPCASVDNYEVGEEFLEYFPRCVVMRDGKYYFDNKKQILLQLVDAGVLIENIEVSPKCTIADRDFHSFRRDKERFGHMAVFIMMKK